MAPTKKIAQTKTVYLRGKGETVQTAALREKKIQRLAKKLDDTESAAVRLMIDAYQD